MSKLKYVAALLSLLAIGCGMEFATHYDRVEENRVRNLAFVYDNGGLAEGAPGDTVKCAVYFAGEEVRNVRLDVTTSLISSFFGSDTFADTVSFNRYIVPGTMEQLLGGNTDSIRFEFVVPEDIIRRQFSGALSIKELLPAGVSDTLLPAAVMSLKPSDIIEVIETIAADASFGTVSMQLLPDSVAEVFPAILQLLTVKMKVFATINNHYRVESTFNVRYNSRFNSALPHVPVNRNPEVGWVKCYRIKGEKVVFDPVEDRDLINAVYDIFPGNDTVVIDVGYHYYFVADSAVASRDSGYSLTGSSRDREPETMVYEWFYQMEDTIAGRPLDSLMVLDNSFGGPSVELLPSLDYRLRNFSLWLVTRDSFLGEKYRPVGFAITCMHGVFSYTEAYKNRHR